jgi:hypothetical protein
MLEPVLALVGLALLAILALPFSGFQKLVLEVYGLVLRLALLALLAGAAVLCLRPEWLPLAETEKVLSQFPRVREVLPEPGSPLFGAAVAGLITAVVLPFLAVIDVARKLAGWRLRRLRVLTRTVRTEPAPAPAPAVPRRVDRRTAANTLAEAGSRKPYRVANHNP